MCLSCTAPTSWQPGDDDPHPTELAGVKEDVDRGLREQAALDADSRARGLYVPDPTTRLYAAALGFYLPAGAIATPVNRFTYRIDPAARQTVTPALVSTLEQAGWEVRQVDGVTWARLRSAVA